MKIRYGFVSNSSSSSFTCDCCGETVSGMDMCISEAGMIQCRNGHTFCESHALSPTLTLEEKRQTIIKLILNRKHYKPEENEAKASQYRADDNFVKNDYEEYNDDECFEEYCPLCQLTDVTDYDVARYFMKKNGFNKTKDVAAAIKAEFGTYEVFNNFINPPKS